MPYFVYIYCDKRTPTVTIKKKALREAYKTEIEIFEWLFTCLKFFLIIAGTAYLREDMFCLSLFMRFCRMYVIYFTCLTLSSL